jgi:TRAP transporter TAXI family solute receptor
MRRRTLLLAGAGVAAGAGAWGATRLTTGGRPVIHEPQVILATGAMQGVYYQFGQAYARVLDPQLGPARLLSTTGSRENLRLLGIGTATFAFSALDAAVDVYESKSPISFAAELRALARLYDDYMHLVVPARSALLSLADLRGHRVSVGPVGSGTALIAERVLAAANLDGAGDLVRTELGLGDSIAALRRGDIDAFFWSGGVPTAGVAALAGTMSIRLVSLGEVALPIRDRYGPSYRTGTIPAFAYPELSVPTTTLAVPNLLLTTTVAAPDQVRELITALFAHAATIARSIPEAGGLDVRAAIFTEPIPLHDAALAFYRSVKAWI